MRIGGATMPVAAPLGLGAATAFLIGISACQLLPLLAPEWVSVALSLSALLAAWRFAGLRLPLLALFGFGYAMWRGELALSVRIAPELEGRELSVSGTVRGFPSGSGEALRFEFEPDSTELDSAAPALRGN